MTTENESKRLREFFFPSIKTAKRILQKTLPDLEETARYCPHLRKKPFSKKKKLKQSSTSSQEESNLNF